MIVSQDSPLKTSTTQANCLCQTYEEDSKSTSPSILSSLSRKIQCSTKFSESSRDDTSFFDLVEQEIKSRIDPCRLFHHTGYCSLGSLCPSQHEDRGIKQIKRELRSENPIHILEEYPDMIDLRSQRRLLMVRNMNE